MKFNRSSFNRKSGQSEIVRATATVELVSDVRDVDITQYAAGLEASFEFDTLSYGLLKKYSKGDAEFMIGANSKSTIKMFNIGALDSDVEIMADALGSTLGEEFIVLEGIVLRPGEEMVINTCDLTATINGENAISSLTVGSDFFDFLSGDNDVIISGENSQGMTVDVYWKDRWL